LEHKIFKSKKLPFVELRYAEKVRGCTKSHTHDVITIAAIREGNINMILSNKTINLSPHKIAFLNPDTAHCVDVLDESHGDYVLHLDKNWCTTIQNELFSNKEYIPVSKVLIKNESIYNDFIFVCDLLLKQSTMMEKEESIISFIINLFSRYCNINHINEKNTHAEKIKSYIIQNIQNNISLEDISEEFGLSKVHIIRVFKKEFDLPIHSYILNKKAHKARELLSTNLSIVSIALESGFFDQSHLNKSFKRIFSITPKEYQDNLSKC